MILESLQRLETARKLPQGRSSMRLHRGRVLAARDDPALAYHDATKEHPGTRPLKWPREQTRVECACTRCLGTHAEWLNSVLVYAAPHREWLIPVSLTTTPRISPLTMPEIEYANTALLSDGHSKGITSIAFNADGTLLATSGLDGAVCVWDTKTWSIQDIYYAKTPVTSLAWFTENALVCGLQDGILSMLVKDGAVSGTTSSRPLLQLTPTDPDQSDWLLGLSLSDRTSQVLRQLASMWGSTRAYGMALAG